MGGACRGIGGRGNGGIASHRDRPDRRAGEIGGGGKPICFVGSLDQAVRSGGDVKKGIVSGLVRENGASCPGVQILQDHGNPGQAGIPTGAGGAAVPVK